MNDLQFGPHAAEVINFATEELNLHGVKINLYQGSNGRVAPQYLDYSRQDIDSYDMYLPITIRDMKLYQEGFKVNGKIGYNYDLIFTTLHEMGHVYQYENRLMRVSQAFLKKDGFLVIKKWGSRYYVYVTGPDSCSYYKLHNEVNFENIDLQPIIKQLQHDNPLVFFKPANDNIRTVQKAYWQLPWEVHANYIAKKLYPKACKLLALTSLPPMRHYHIVNKQRKIK